MLPRQITIPGNRRQATQLIQAFTLAELLVGIGVIAILVSLAAPAIARARQHAKVLRCTANIHQLGTLVTAYSNDFRSIYPTWVTPLSPVQENPDWWRFYTLQYQRFFFRDAWLRYSGLPVNSPVYRCPDNQPFRNTGKSASDYSGSAAFHASAPFLNPALPPNAWTGQFGAMPQSVSAVRFPSAKAGLFETKVWHAWRGTYADEGANVTGLSFYDSPAAANLWFVDGHVEAMHFRDTIPAVDRAPSWHSQRVVLTAFGVEGRDK